jgi:hypothetical protein
LNQGSFALIIKGEMRMKKFSVLVSTTFDGYVEVDASSSDEAIVKVWEMLRIKEINPIKDFDPYNDVVFAEEIQNV